MSLPATAAQICEWTGGSLLRGRPDQTFAGTRIDSREVGPEDLFVAIVGPNHDAHSFVSAVLLSGAAGALIQNDRMGETIGPGEGFVIHVKDTTRALADIARGHRQSFDGPLIGITGSNGKTTTKELCADILRRQGSTLATKGNLNNNYGVPLTLLCREASDAFAIIEMGMNHRGEIATLCEIAEPTIGVLTNVGTAHIEFLGSREAIAEEKGDLLAALPAGGTAVLPRDYPLAFAQAARTKASVLSFGQDATAELRASEIRYLESGHFAFHLDSPFGKGEIRVPGLAETIVENALAAAGGAFAAGVSFETVADGLAHHGGIAGRMQPRSLDGEILLIDDTYNANPQSMQNALETLARIPVQGKRFVALGQMGELGEMADAAHRELGALAARLGFDGLFVLAPAAQLIAKGARDAGMPSEQVHEEADHSFIAEALRARLGKGDAVLVKGSRAARMERVIDAIEEGHN
ncbi:MAG: UDP-N-acetylmuramoyl-tripeptide--D-alanyl-D-alanine ligase [Myxococcota bacterium]